MSRFPLMNSTPQPFIMRKDAPPKTFDQLVDSFRDFVKDMGMSIEQVKRSPTTLTTMRLLVSQMKEAKAREGRTESINEIIEDAFDD